MLGLKNKNVWLMLFILALGTVLRLIFIDKPEGLWNDEYISWAIASIPLGKSFINAVVSQCHMPFYYLYLKFFIHFFGNGDLMLRLTSVLAGVLSILGMYFAGKEFKDEKLGILCASITALSSFLIYFSQEVRFYQILFLFSSLSLLFTLRLVKNQNKFNFIFYLISNFLIIFTHTIGFVFVFFNMAFVSSMLIKNEKFKKPIVVTWSSAVLFCLVIYFLAPKIFAGHVLSQWWSAFSISKLGFLITDYFSPILTNIVSAPDNFFYNFTFLFVIFALIPSAIAVAAIIRAILTKEQNILGLFYISLAYLLFLIIMAITGKLVFITKYSIEIYPILIAIMGFGLLEFRKEFRYGLIFLFCFLNLFYILTALNSAPRMHRSEGHKIVSNLLANSNLNDDDIVLLNYYPKDRFEKYFNFDNYRVISINKGNFQDYLGFSTKGGFKTVDPKYFDKKFKKEILNKLKPKQQLALVVLNDVAIYSPVQMRILLDSNDGFRKAPFLFLVFSQIKNKAIQESLENLQIKRVENKGSWSVMTFQKY